MPLGALTLEAAGRGATARRVVGERLTIGRGADADWALEDPDQIMSRQHCVIECRDGHYWVIDESRNGTFLNDQPIPPGTPHRLRDGDRLRLGDQVLTARLEGDETTNPRDQVTFDPDRVLDQAPDQPAAPPRREDGGPLGIDLDDDGAASPPGPASPPLRDERSFDTEFGGGTAESPADEPGPPSDAGDDLFGTEFDLVTPSSPPRPPAPSQGSGDDLFGTEFEVVTPSSPRSAGSGGRGDDPFGTELDVATSSTPPSGPEGAGDDLFGTDFPVQRPPSTARETRSWRSPEPAEVKPADGGAHHHSPLDDYFPPPKPRRRAPAPAPAPRQEAELLAAFLRGADLDRSVLGDRDAAALMKEVGRCFRVTAEGLRDNLASRAMVKGEAGMENTLPGVRDSNPLKHLRRGEDVVRALLDPGAAGFLPPSDAMAAGFKDIGVHEIALLAAMRALVHTVLGRLDPKALEAEADKDGGLRALAAGGRKALAFEVLMRRHAALGREADDLLRGELGKVFREAYQQQARKL